MSEGRERIQKDHRSSLCRRHASTIGKVAFSFWSLGPSRLVPDRAARAVGAGPASERKKLSDLDRAVGGERRESGAGLRSAPLVRGKSISNAGRRRRRRSVLSHSLPPLLSHSFSLTLFLFLFLSRGRLTCHGDAKQRSKLDRLPNVFPVGSVIIRLCSRGHAQWGCCE